MPKFVVCYTVSDNITYSYECDVPVIVESKEAFLEAYLDVVEKREQYNQYCEELQQQLSNARATGDQKKIDGAWNKWLAAQSTSNEYRLEVLGYDISDFETHHIGRHNKRVLQMPDIFTIEEWFDRNHHKD